MATKESLDVFVRGTEPSHRGNLQHLVGVLVARHDFVVGKADFEEEARLVLVSWPAKDPDQAALVESLMPWASYLVICGSVGEIESVNKLLPTNARAIHFPCGLEWLKDFLTNGRKPER